MSPNTAPGSSTRVRSISFITTSTAPLFRNSSRPVVLPSASTTSPASYTRIGNAASFSKSSCVAMIGMGRTSPSAGRDASRYRPQSVAFGGAGQPFARAHAPGGSARRLELELDEGELVGIGVDHVVL